MTSTPPTILLTGTSGFIALNILKILLEEGQFKVRGTVRSTANTDRTKPIYDLVPDAKYPVELVEANLTSDEGWNEAVKGCKYVIHTASPFFIAHGHAAKEQLIKPAVEGTKRVLNACAQEDSQVERVVLTSSMAAVAYGNNNKNDYIYTEKDWTNVANTDPYGASKTLAERAAWEFVEKNEKHKFELVAINPGMVFGKFYGTPGTSVNVIREIMNGAYPMAPLLNFGAVDVYDVALAHVRAVTVPEAAGERFILSARAIWVKDICAILAKEFNSQGYHKFPTREMPWIIAKFASFGMAGMKTVMQTWNQSFQSDGSKVTKLLKVEYTPCEKTFNDTAYCLIERGLVAKTSKYTGPKTEETHKE